MNDKHAKSEIIADLTKSKLFFKEYLNYFPKDSFKINGAYSAVEKKEENTLQYKKKLRQNNEDLWDASEEGNLNKLLEIFSRDCFDINSNQLDNMTALHFAASEGHCEIIIELLKHGANIESKTTNLQRTALHISALRGFSKAVEILANNGANVNSEDCDGNTALHIASVFGYCEIVDFLLKKGANPKKINLYKMDAIDLSYNEETRRVYEKYLNQEDLIGHKDFVGGIPLISGRDKYVGNVLRFAQTSAAKEKSLIVKNEIKEKSETLQKGGSQLKTGSKISKIPLEKEEKKINYLDHFEIGRSLGKGGFAEVFLVKKKTDEKFYAMKVIEKDKLKVSNLAKYAHTERNILSIMDHPFIVKLNSAFQTKNKLYLVMDYCPGGDLNNHLNKVKRVAEPIAKIYASEILLALEALHENCIIFRDLKPDNVVLDKDGHALLTDFGLSKEGLQKLDLTNTFCGTFAYLAPEIIDRRGHNRTLDWYLFGCFIYELLVGLPPFFDRNPERLVENIKAGCLRYPNWAISLEAKDLIEKLLCRDPTQRLGYMGDANEIKKHPWFKDLIWEEVYQRKLKPPPINDNNKFLENSRFDREEEITNTFDTHKFLNWTFIGEEF